MQIFKLYHHNDPSITNKGGHFAHNCIKIG